MSKNLKDHRQLGKELDLYSFHDVAPGAIFWHDKGYKIYRTLIDFLRKSLLNEGYDEISTPVMVKKDLFIESGHWDFYSENLFNVITYTTEEKNKTKELIEKHIVEELNKEYEETREKNPKAILQTFTREILLDNKVVVHVIIHLQRISKDESAASYTYVIEFLPDYSLKPMNCPESTLIYSSTNRSYQDLPIRLAEFGLLNRNELSGVLGGLFRVRQFMIDDAHHYVRPNQILKEIHELLVYTVDLYKKFGFETSFYLATKPDRAMGDPKLWKEAEKDLEQALKDSKVKYSVKEKDGAFYGPKIDIHIKDSQDRDWQLATIQLDFQIPEKMKLEYTDSDGKAKRPVMVHRAVLGSIERFIGILVEHYQGAFPLWLSPVQVVIISVSDKHNKLAEKVYKKLLENDVRVELNLENKTVGNKIREATLQKIPYMVIIGDKEKQKSNDKNLFGSVRTREGKDEGLTNINEFISKLKAQIETFS